MSRTQTDATGQLLATKPAAEREQVQETAIGLLRRSAGELQKALPRHMPPDRFARIVLTAIRQTPELAETTPVSFMGSVMQLAALGLEPNTPLGHAYLIPRRNSVANREHPILECTIQIGYKGYVELAARAGASLVAHVVREGDLFEWCYGTQERLTHRYSSAPDREDQPIVAAWAKAERKQTPAIFRVLSWGQLEARRKRSPKADSGPWLQFREAMYQKTAARALEPWIPKTADFARAAWLEDRSELGDRQSLAFDPDVLDSLSRIGLDPEGASA